LTAATCRWCGLERELHTGAGVVSHLVPGPSGEVLEVPYDEVCSDCFSEIVEEWKETGNLSRPVSSYGGASA